MIDKTTSRNGDDAPTGAAEQLTRKWGSPAEYLDHLAKIATPKEFFIEVPLLDGKTQVLVADSREEAARLIRAGGKQADVETL